MNFFKKRMCVFLLGLGSSVVGQAQESLKTGSMLPASFLQAPVSGVYDSAGFFSRNSEVIERISNRIQKLDQDHGYKIYLVVEPVLLTSSAPEFAALLRQAWVPDGNGMVLVFESDSRKLGVGRDLTSNPVEEKSTTQLPSDQTHFIVERVMNTLDSKSDPIPYLEGLVGKLADEVDSYFLRPMAPPPAQRSVKLGLLIAGGLALLGLVAIAIGSFIRNSSMAKIPCFRFPVVDRPERLGAPCGSSVTARRFAPARTRR